MTKSRSDLGIGKRVRQQRQKRGLSTIALDDELGRSHGYTSRLENTGRNPRADTLVALSEALDVCLAWLITGKGDP